MSANKLILVFLAAIVATSKSDPSLGEIQTGEERRFDSELDIRVFVKSKEKDSDGKCFQKIKFTLPGGPTKDEVYVKCFTDYTKRSLGNEFWLGDVVYSDDPTRLYVISDSKECVLWTNDNGSLVGPKTQDDAKCKEIKAKLKRDGEGMFGKLINGIKRFGQKINPSYSSASLFPKH